MKYEISKKNRGTKKLTAIHSFESSLEYDDIVEVNGKFILLSSSDRVLSKISDVGFEEVFVDNLPEKPSIGESIFEERICLVGNGIRHIERIGVNSGERHPHISKSAHETILKSLESFVDVGETNCCVNRRGWLYVLNKCQGCIYIFKKKSSYSRVGQMGPYGVSSDLSQTSFNKPEWIDSHGQNVIICDTGNSCIRELSEKGVSLVSGLPMQRGFVDGSKKEAKFNNPTIVKVGKRLIYVVDGPSVRAISRSDNSVSTLINDVGNAKICTDDKDNLFILGRA
jgi:hypothetical protein